MELGSVHEGDTPAERGASSSREDEWSEACSSARSESSGAACLVAPVQADGTVRRREKARVRGVRDRHMISLWLPASVLHRVQGEWVLIVDEALKMAGNSRRRSNAPRSRQVVIPIHSLGVSLLSRLPGCCARCCGAGALAASRSVLVRIHPADMPKSIRFAITPERLRSGGALRSTISPRASPMAASVMGVYKGRRQRRKPHNSYSPRRRKLRTKVV